MGRERIVWLDLMRTCAIVFVVLCHSIEQVYDMSLQGWRNIDTFSKIFRAGGFVLGRLGVPLFLYLTGYLVLSKVISCDNDGIKFYKKSLIPLLICSEIWIVIYNIWNAIINKQGLDFVTLIRNMCFFKATNMTNMWYMPMILGIYLAIPFLSIIVQKFSGKILMVPLIIGVFYNFVIPSINLILDIMKIEKINDVINIMFLGGWYATYVFIGYYFVDGQISWSANNKLVFFIISYMITVASQYAILEIGYEYNLWYNFIGVIITSFFLFLLIEEAKNILLPEKIRHMIIFLSKASLGIFFLHKPVLTMLGFFKPICDLKKPIQSIVLFISSFIICAVIIKLFMPVKMIREKVFFIKD